MNDCLLGPPPRSRRRRLLTVVLGLLLLLGVPAGLYFVLGTQAERDLRVVLAEIDRREPEGWRLDELEARRPTLADEENAAVCVLAVQRSMRPLWPPVPVQPPPDSGMLPLIDQRLGELPPPVLLDRALAEELRSAMDDVAPAVQLARRLRDLRRGRYPIQWSPNVLGFQLTSPDARPVAHMLSWQARWEAHEEEIHAALDTCRDLIGVARSIDDEPMTNSQFIRLSIQGLAVSTLQVILAQGQASPAVLEVVQKALEEEAAVPVMLHAARGKRALAYETTEGLKDGRISPVQVGAAPPLAALGPNGVYLWAGRSEARLMGIFNDLVEIAERPPHEQRSRFLAAVEEQKRAVFKEKHQLIQLLVPALDRVSLAYQRGQAYLRCAILAVAAERYRLDHGPWPDRTELLTPRYVASLPLDPFDGAALRWKRLADGVLVYSVGPDGTDNGGRFDGKNPVGRGTDVGIRLWNEDRRRREAAESLPLPVESLLEGGSP